MQNKRKIKNYCQILPLEEMWIGGCYPPNFFDHLDNKYQDIFSLISEKTNSDFDVLEKKLLEFDIIVHRPQFTRVDDYLSDQDKLIKPPITPCDFALTINDHLYIIPQYQSGVEPFEHALEQYDPDHYTILDRSIPDSLCYLVFSSYIKIGKDIFIDYNKIDPDYEKHNWLIINELAKSHRVHVSYTGDHNDSVFCPVKNKKIITTPYKKNYKKWFPDWDVFFLDNLSNDKVQRFNTEHKWFIPGVDYLYYNSEILEIAEKWLGEPTETIFEINMVVIDESNVLVVAENEKAFRFFEEIGITPHVVDFETKHFWDAGLHCFTRDINRRGDSHDYWPGRGPNGVYTLDD